LKNLKYNEYLFVIQVKQVVLNESFRVNPNKLMCQTCL